MTERFVKLSLTLTLRDSLRSSETESEGGRRKKETKNRRNRHRFPLLLSALGITLAQEATRKPKDAEELRSPLDRQSRDSDVSGRFGSHETTEFPRRRWSAAGQCDFSRARGSIIIFFFGGSTNGGMPCREHYGHASRGKAGLPRP